MDVFQPVKDWLAYRSRRREAHREMGAERRARGTKRGDVIGQGPHEPTSTSMGGPSGGFGTTGGKELGKLDE